MFNIKKRKKIFLNRCCNRNKLFFYNVKKEELDNFLDDDNLVIIDVRSKEEFLKMRMKKAINLDVCNIECTINNFYKDRKTKIFIYCLNGSRTKIAINKLNKMGYYNLYICGTGGINEFNNEKYIEY